MPAATSFSPSSVSNNVLVVGYGNVTRQDDGAGVHVAERIRNLSLPRVTVWTCHQLNLELLEDMDPFSTIILIDAGQQEETVVLRQINIPTHGGRLSSSHHMSPEFLARMALTLYHRVPRLFVCSIQAEQFALNESIRPQLEPKLRQAEELVLNLIQKEQHHA